MIWPLIIGLGSDSGDDCAGWLIVRRLQHLGYPTGRLKEALHPVDLLDHLDASDQIIVCDACRGAGAVGTIHHWKWPCDDMRRLSSHSTHQMELNEILELAVQLNQHAQAVDIWAVEGETWLTLSAANHCVVAAADRAAQEIWSSVAYARTIAG